LVKLTRIRAKSFFTHAFTCWKLDSWSKLFV